MFTSAVSSRLAGILITLLAGAPNVLAAPELTLAEAERLALEQAPGLARARSSVAAVSERTAYEGRLPDPQLVIGALNVPADSYSFRREDARHPHAPRRAGVDARAGAPRDRAPRPA